MKTYILGNEMCGHLIFPFIESEYLAFFSCYIGKNKLKLKYK